ncbi:MAG: DUF3135 domain-containing protein [Granulosicoccus sp.]
MADQSMNDFDFDDWAGLHLEDPQEFEARRQTALMIQMTQGSAEQCESGRALLAAYEKRVEGCDTPQHMNVAAEMMVESAKQLNTELMLLKQTLERALDGRVSESDTVEVILK